MENARQRARKNARLRRARNLLKMLYGIVRISGLTPAFVLLKDAAELWKESHGD